MMDLKVVVVVVALMAQVQLSVQLRFNHPLHGVVDRINQKAKGSYIGLVMAYSTEEAALQATGHFVPSLDIPWVDLAGRRFNIGKIKGVDVIYVKSGEEMLNAGITVQILVDAFDIKGIVHYGIAGSANASLSIGDVGVLNDVAFTGSWNWKEFKAEEGTLPELKFGAFNVPENCQNLLANIEFTSQQLFSVGKPVEDVFWQPIEPKWLSIASQLQNLTLQQCLKTYCLPKAPQIVYGLRDKSNKWSAIYCVSWCV
ncbi:bark storage protein A-like [Quillaja saponaria]|uniref:Bark storage protein A-like n=1 Tax=Quillaja saponaria TaxID=32244 RepID=A0AAD7L1T3_QUISA|nr:bark storage protein A-like [Quillaja saponaria]